MTKVFCKAACTYSIDGICANNEILMDIEGCESWKEYPQPDDPEYQSEFWMAMRFNKRSEKTVDGEKFTYGPVEVRTKCKGKKVEFGGLTFYTRDDVRYGLENADFTEEKTGMKIPGYVMNLKDIETVKQRVNEKPSVMELPEYKEEEE